MFFVNKFTTLTTNFPDNVKQWTMQLYSTYVAVLSDELFDAIGNKNKITTPDATSLDTNSKQLDFLTVNVNFYNKKTGIVVFPIFTLKVLQK